MINNSRKADALDYHARGKAGKIEVIPTKSAKTQRDLSLAYSPGVAEPCIEIKNNINEVYKYTAKSNLVAVITNGTAVLGLGNIGPEASKPVMEGKGVLFKVFADIDVFDLEINETDPKKFVEIVKSLGPTFGGINLEDIKSPECFEIEHLLKKHLDIPVMHDDQHGTAIISTAALINALEIQRKKISKVKFIVSGAGAASIACMNLYISMGAKIENIFLFDSVGMVYEGRKDLNYLKKPFALGKKKDLSLEKAMDGSDVFIGLSKGNLLNKAMIKSMAKNPIVFAMANPQPEIDYDVALSIRTDIIMGTGRSDFPNQVNNVLGFPYIFRGALDCRASCINEEMKIAAVKALAQLAKESVPDIVNMAYGIKTLSFGKEYVIPKPLDPRLITTVAPAVAKAAIESGVARITNINWDEYEQKLKARLGQDNQFIRAIGIKARKDPKRVLYLDGENINIIKAAQIAFEENVALPLLMGNEENMKKVAKENNIDISPFPIIYPRSQEMFEKLINFSNQYYNYRKRKGINRFEAKIQMFDRAYFGAMMLMNGECDAVLSNISRNYHDTLKPAIEIIGCQESVKHIAGMHILLTKRGPIFLADTTVHFQPSAEEIANITFLVAEEIYSYGITPKIALLSHSNFGSSDAEEAVVVQKAIELIKKNNPNFIVDGEMQGVVALNKEILKENFPFSELLDQKVNTLIFPNLSASNIAYNLLQELGEIDSIGPIIIGLKKPIHVLQISSSVQHIFNMTLIATIDAQNSTYHVSTQDDIKKKSKDF